VAEQFQHSFGGSRKDVGFPLGTVDMVLSKGVREGWAVQKRNWGREVDSFTYCFLSPSLLLSHVIRTTFCVLLGKCFPH